MGHPTDPLMRVATSGTIAAGKHYANTPATAGLVLTSAGPDVVPVWGPGGIQGINVNRVMFVDGTFGPVGTGDGRINNPFRTLQEAIDAVEAAGWNDAILQVAPGSYVAAHTIGPSATLDDLVINGWATTDPLTNPDDLPNIGGQVTVNVGTRVHFSNCSIAAIVTSPNPNADDLEVSYDNCELQSATLGDDLVVTAQHTAFAQNASITGNSSTTITFDGWSWATHVNAGSNIAPIGYTRTFLDTGADTNVGNLTTTAPLALGAQEVVAVPYPSAREGEFAIGSLTAAVPPTDFAFGFHHCETDVVYFWLMNLPVGGRVPGDFDEELHVVVFHDGMPTPPVIP